MKRIFISADHGLALIYFLQSTVASRLLAAGVEVIVLTDDALTDAVAARFGQPGLVFEGLRLAAARRYFQTERPAQQYWLDFFRRAGASNRINLEAVESYVRQVQGEAEGTRRALFPLMRAGVEILRRAPAARQAVRQAQMRFIPGLYTDLFDRYRPDLVVGSTPGWRLDRYLLREAAQRGIRTGAVIVGWDNSSSYSLPGAPVEFISCWSELQKAELVQGADWEPERVQIGGIPSYDGYFREQWRVGKAQYYAAHGLDPARKLIAYAASFIPFSPNIQNIESLAQLVGEDQLSAPAQLLIRLHPNHFMDVPRFAAEREQVRALARRYRHVHVVEPVAIEGGGSLGRYSGEDMEEKSSMMAYADVFTTVYSTMVVEAAAHHTPVVSVCIDHPVGWTENFYLPLSQIGNWPTHARFRESGAGQVALNLAELRAALNGYLENREAQAAERQAFIAQECTYTDGSAGQRTGDFLASQV